MGVSLKDNIFHSLKQDIEAQECIDFYAILPLKNLKINGEKVEVKDFDYAFIYGADYFVVAIYQYKDLHLNYNFDLIRINDQDILDIKVNLVGEFMLNYSNDSYSFNANLFSAESEQLIDFYNFIKNLPCQVKLEKDSSVNWGISIFVSVIFGLIALFAVWILVGLLSLTYEHVNNSKRVFIILIPFGFLYSLIKGTLFLKILYFLSLVGTTCLIFLSGLSNAKKGKEIIGNLVSD